MPHRTRTTWAMTVTSKSWTPETVIGPSRLTWFIPHRGQRWRWDLKLYRFNVLLVLPFKVLCDQCTLRTPSPMSACVPSSIVMLCTTLLMSSIFTLWLNVSNLTWSTSTLSLAWYVPFTLPHLRSSCDFFPIIDKSSHGYRSTGDQEGCCVQRPRIFRTLYQNLHRRDQCTDHRRYLHLPTSGMCRPSLRGHTLLTRI